MPFRRRRMPRRSRSTAVKALKLARKAWKSQDHEVKVVDDNYQATAILTPTGALLVHLNGIGEGTGNHDRIGERAAMKSLDLRLTFYRNPTQVEEFVTIRFLIIWDKQPNGTLATVANVFESSALGDALAGLQSPYNVNTSKRFQILLDRTFSLNDGDVQMKPVHWRVPLRQKITQYNGAGTAISSVNTGALLALAMGNEGTINFSPFLSGQYRLRFVG